jgi:hypothetical protein
MVIRRLRVPFIGYAILFATNALPVVPKTRLMPKLWKSGKRKAALEICS